MARSTSKGVADGLATLNASGKVPTAQLPDGLDDIAAQAAAVADLGALTSSAPAALTSAQITGGEAPTEAEYNQLQADAAAIRTTVAAVVTDLATIRTKVNALLGSLRTAGVIDT
jgi:hypothetical protein